MTWRRAGRITLFSLVFLAALVLIGAVALWLALRASLPTLDGSLALRGLSKKVVVERDDLGVPTVRAENRIDAARATGFLHAQDRFFQMDLARRLAAGELSELLGATTVETDRAFRLHRLRITARQVVAQLSVSDRAILDAYCAGVRAGLEALGARPPEYLLLRSRPAPWLAEDSILAGHSMFIFLQDENGREDTAFEVLRKVLSPVAFRFFVPLGTEWDAAIDGTLSPAPAIPSPAELSFSADEARPAAGLLPGQVFAGLWSSPGGSSAAAPDFWLIGSNSWAVSGSHTSSGAALVANDMHLGLRLPNTWYRMRIVCQGVGAPSVDITGVTLPGVPAVIVGSNRHIAWGFTNAGVDTTDLVLLQTSPADPQLYRTPDGWKRFEQAHESIKVAGGDPVALNIESTIWGPVISGPKGLPKRAIRWVAQLPEATNFGLSELESAREAETALRLAPGFGVPVQNFVVGDSAGHIGWTLMGRLPRRIGYSGSEPVSFADGTRRWDGWLPANQYPRVFDPPQGRVWTANNRIAGSAEYLSTGPWITDLGARARQIRDDLAVRETFSPEDMLDIQLDNRAVFLERWRTLLLKTLAEPALSGRAESSEMRALVERWGGRASLDSVGYRLVRGFRNKVTELTLEPIVSRCRSVWPEFNYPTPQLEAPVWTLLEKRPAHLLNPRFKDYESLLVSAVEALESDLKQQGLSLPQATWGQRNLVLIRHPLSGGVPLFGAWLDIPPESLPGDSGMPRVQSPGHGASERLAVSPGHEDQATFHMPGGQSGHFLSPYYRAGHRAWAEGRPAPFLPGPTRHTLTFTR